MLNEAPQRRRVEPASARGQEQRVLGTARQLGSCVTQVAGHEQGGLLAERDDAVLAALPFAHVHTLLLEVDVAEVQPDRFGGAEAA